MVMMMITVFVDFVTSVLEISALHCGWRADNKTMLYVAAYSRFFMS